MKTELGKRLIETWVESLKHHISEDIVKLYSNDGVLLGTLAEDPLVGKYEIKTYFDDFLKKHPISVITWWYTQRLGFNKIVVNGNYTFEVDHKKARKEVEARFTFVFKRNWLRFGKWEIITHHSSERPEKHNLLFIK